MHNTGFFPLTSSILATGIFFGGIAQMIAGVEEWKVGNTFGATAFTSYGAFWLSLVGLIALPKWVSHLTLEPRWRLTLACGGSLVSSCSSAHCVCRAACN
jgi:succinate-acetate transporter protein